MLRITVPKQEFFDDDTEQFVILEAVDLELEHSLVSVSKWESEVEKPFISQDQRTLEETILYIKAMVLGPEVPEEVFSRLSTENLEAVNAYITAKMTASVVNRAPGVPRRRAIITNELVYYWMTVFNIPFTCETWHLNRLLMLIEIADVKQGKEQKLGRADSAAEQKRLNAERRAAAKARSNGG